MAFGIDDALAAAAAGINLTDTVVQTVKRYRKSKQDIDIERLIEEVRITALTKLDQADDALKDFERMLLQRGIDTSRPLTAVIAATPFWQPFEQQRLKRIQKSFNQLWDGIYSAGDDIAALVRCRDDTGPMGAAVVASAKSKHQLNRDLLNAPTLHDSIRILRDKITEHKEALMG